MRVYSCTDFSYKIWASRQPKLELDILGSFPSTSCNKSYSILGSNIIFQDIFYVTEKEDLLRKKQIQKRMWGGICLAEVCMCVWVGCWLNAAEVQVLSFSREHCWFRFGSQGKMPGALFTGDERLIWVCVPLMGLPDQLRMLSSLVNVELAHGGWLGVGVT